LDGRVEITYNITLNAFRADKEFLESDIEIAPRRLNIHRMREARFTIKTAV